MSPTPLSQQPIGHAVTDIAEGAAITYWLHKSVTDNDPEDSEGRIVPSPNVRNHAEYAGVVGGQLSAAHLLWPLLIKFLALPLFVLSGALVVGGAIGVYHLCLTLGLSVATANEMGGYAFIFLFLGWAGLLACAIRSAFRLLIKRGPSMHYADGYQGPFSSRDRVHPSA